MPRPLSTSPKWNGEIAETEFEVAARKRGFAVATPSTECLPFDRIVITRRHIWKIQVKLAGARYKGCYRASIGRATRARRRREQYRAGDFDFLAAVTPERKWYIIPFAKVGSRLTLHLPGPTSRPNSLFAPYLNRWDLLV